VYIISLTKDIQRFSFLFLI